MIDNRKKYAPNKRAHKFYLSDDARDRLRAEGERLSLPMSTVVELLIREHLPPLPKELRPQ